MQKKSSHTSLLILVMFPGNYVLTEGKKGQLGVSAALLPPDKTHTVFAVHQLSELYFTFRTCLTPEFHWWRIGPKLIVCVRTQCTHTWSGTYWNGNYATELCIFVSVRVGYVTSFQTWFLPLESNTPFWLRVKHLSMWQTIIYTLWGCVTWYIISTSTKASRTSTSVSEKKKKKGWLFSLP